MANENINEANVNENAEVVEEVITEETAETVEEVENEPASAGPYAALGGTVSDQKIPKINKNKVLNSIPDDLKTVFGKIKDKNGDVIYTTIETYNKRAQNADTNISSPMHDPNGKVAGSVEVGFF